MADALRAHLRARTGQPVALHETHISWVLLTKQHAYKLKKPVRLPFLDFSTAELREHFCEEELRVNRRWAPALYLGLVAVRGTPAAPHLGGRGPVIDHVVQMRRFADDDLLDHRLQRGRVTPADIDALAHQVAAMHDQAPVLPPTAPLATPARVARPMSAVLAQVEQRFGARAVAGVKPWLAEQARILAPAWRRRRAHGAVRECHGDLHLDNLAWVDGRWCAFDAIEFDPSLRWIDVMADLAFLTMDLRAHGHAPFAHRLLDAYLERRGDFDGLQVLRCYEVYRALVRALALGLRPPEARPAGPTAARYLACARALVREARRGARLLMTCGVAGSGKSTAAERWVEREGAVRIRSDVERKRLFGLQALDRSAGRGLQIYDTRATQHTYHRLAQCARAALAAGRPVIVDATFLRQAQRRPFVRLAQRLGVPFTILHCTAPQAVLQARIAARRRSGRDASEADLRVLAQQLQAWEPLTPQEQAHALRVTARKPPGAAGSASAVA